MKKNKIIKMWAILILLIMVLVAIYKIYVFREQDKLIDKDSVKILAVIVKIKNGAVRSPASAVFKYEVAGKGLEFEESGNYKSFKIGDTVKIEYATEDPSLARVVNKYYMQKYRYLENGNSK